MKKLLLIFIGFLIFSVGNTQTQIECGSADQEQDNFPIAFEDGTTYSGTILTGISKTLFYVRDASGNVMATYELKESDADLYLKEVNLYGSDRLGLLQVDEKLLNLPSMNYATSNTAFTQNNGDRYYELSNHLGNVLSVVSDRLLPTESTVTSGLVDYYSADIVSSSDYYPFGMMMPGRKFNSPAYRYGFGGHEKDDEISGASGTHYATYARPYDSRLGRWWSIDPKFRKQPGWSTYKAFLDNPILYQDPAGETEYTTTIIIDEKTGKSVKLSVVSDSKLMTDGRKYQEETSGQGYTDYNYYFDYEIITTVIRHKDGTETTSDPTNRIMYENDVQSKEGWWVFGDNKGETKTDWGGVWNRLTGAVSIGGIHVWGSAPNSDNSPARKSNDAWGTFDFAAFSDMIGLITRVLKTQKENAIGTSQQDAKNKILGEFTKSADFPGNKGSGKTRSTHCEFCNGNYVMKEGELTREETEDPAVDTTNYH